MPSNATWSKRWYFQPFDKYTRPFFFYLVDDDARKKKSGKMGIKWSQNDDPEFHSSLSEKKDPGKNVTIKFHIKLFLNVLLFDELSFLLSVQRIRLRLLYAEWNGGKKISQTRTNSILKWMHTNSHQRERSLPSFRLSRGTFENHTNTNTHTNTLRNKSIWCLGESLSQTIRYVHCAHKL